MKSISKKIKNYLFELFMTVLEIIEDKPNFLFSKKIYCILMTVNIFQISGYIFCTTGARYFQDQKITIVAHINEVSTGTFLLLLKGNDNLTIFFFLILQLVVYSYTIYVIILNYIKNHQRSWYLQNKKTFMTINQMLIVFFTLYYWIFLTPFTEVGLGMLSCNENAFLQAYRNKGNCSHKPQIWNILGSLAVVLSVTTNILISFFFRNYEFCESNLLKRKFANLQIPITFSFFFLQMIYYLGEILPSYFKYIIAQVMGILMILDIFLNYPYRDQIISIFYIIGTSFFWVSHTILTIFFNLNSFKSTELFYLMSFSIVLVAFLIYSLSRYQYDQMLNQCGSSTLHSQSRTQDDIDFYLEQFWLTSQQAQKNDKSRIILLRMVSQHREHCRRDVCNCKLEDLYNDKQLLREELVKNIIDTVFIDSLQSKAAIKNRETREHLFLKHITFIAKFQRNPLRSYYELKKYQRTYPNDKSSYFIGVSQVLSKTFEQMITSNQELLYSMQKQELNSTFNQKVTLSMNDILKTQEIQNQLVPLLAEYTRSKLQHFQQLMSSASSMESIRNASKQLYAKQIKIRYIFQIIIFNEVKKPLLLERQMANLIQKGSARPLDELNSFQLVNGNIITILTSPNQNFKIMNHSNTQLADFFGYNQIQFSNVKKIENLMPSYISNIHSQLISGFIHKGHSNILSTNHKVFSLSKNGFIFPVNLQVSINYQYNDDFIMTATILKLISQSGYIVFNQSGKIKGIDKVFFSTFFDLKTEDDNYEDQQENADDDQNQQIILKEINKINMFLFFPSLINTIKQFYKELPTYTGVEQDIQQEINNKINDKNMNLKSISRRLIFSKKDIQLNIPFNLIELNQHFDQQLQDYQKQAKINLQYQTQKSSNSSKNSQSHYKSLDELNFFQRFYKKLNQEWNKTNCIRNINCQANLIVHIINSYNQRHQHIIEDQEFIFELEINDLKQYQKKAINIQDLQNKHSYKQNLQVVQEYENSFSESVSNTEFTSEKTGSQFFKQVLKNELAIQDQQRNTQINFKHIQDQNPNQLNKQNDSTQNTKNQFPSQVLVSQTSVEKVECSNGFDTIERINQTNDKQFKDLKPEEKIQEEDYNNLNLLSQIPSNKNLLSQQELEMIYLSPKHFKSEKNLNSYYNDKDNEENTYIFSKTSVHRENSNNQLQKTQQIISLNNISLPHLAQLPIKSHSEQLKSFDGKNLNNNGSFQLIELYRKSLILKSKQISEVQQQNKLVKYKTELQTDNIRNTPSRPTDNTDKQEKEAIKLNKKIQMENILEGSSTTSKSSNNQNLIVDQIIHKRSIKSSCKTTLLILFNILAFICIFVAYQIQMRKQLNSLQDSINTSQQQSLLGQYYDQQALTQLIKYEYNLNMLPKDLESVVKTFDQSYCQQIRSNFQTELQKNFNSIIEQYQNQNQIEVNIFSLKQKQVKKVNYLEYYLLALQNLREVCQEDNKKQSQINAIYFMYENQIGIQSISTNFIENNFNQQEIIIDQLQKCIMLTIIITVVLIFITQIASIPLMRQINKFQEIIYSVLLRTTFDEVDKEIKKLELFYKHLMSHHYCWIGYNFCNDFIQEKAATLQVNSVDGSTTISTKVALKQKRKNKVESKIQQQHISSKLSNQKLSVFKYLIQLSFFGITAICFLAVSFIFFNQQQSYLKEKLDVYNMTIKSKLAFHSIITLSEFAFRKSAILQFDQNFPTDQYQYAVKSFNQDQDLLKSYINYMSNALQNTSIFGNENINYLQNLFTQNLCDIFKDEQICQNSITKQKAINGFFSIISSYLYYFQQFNQLIEGSLSQKQMIQLSEEYSSLEQYKYLIVQGFQLPVETFNLIQNEIYQVLTNQINLIQQFQILYMIIGEITLIVIWLIYSFYIKYKITLDIHSAQFALTCLPFQKAQEETIIYLLKSIFKY
ncbi:hypothetical protein ABPG74_019697 [Tetrahymena malaccensis]